MPTSSRPCVASSTRPVFPPHAYAFVRDALEHTTQSVHGVERAGGARQNRHVTGAQLCAGFRELASSQFGRLAPVVLAHWGIARTEDIGAIVFSLIEAGLLNKTDDDTIEHFHGVYDFREAFGQYPMG